MYGPDTIRRDHGSTGSHQGRSDLVGGRDFRAGFLLGVACFALTVGIAGSSPVSADFQHSRPNGSWIVVNGGINYTQVPGPMRAYRKSGSYWYEISDGQAALGLPNLGTGSWSSNPGEIIYSVVTEIQLCIGADYASAIASDPITVGVAPELIGQVSIISEQWNYVDLDLPFTEVTIDRTAGTIVWTNPVITPDPPDSDGDGIPDDEDPDDDNDGIPDEDDSDHPDYVPDLDGDGIPDDEDPDRDGDGILNDHDPQPDDPLNLDPGDGGDTDGDGTPDNEDPDDDNDGTPDIVDPDPKNPPIGGGGGSDPGPGGGGDDGAGGGMEDADIAGMNDLVPGDAPWSNDAGQLSPGELGRIKDARDGIQGKIEQLRGVRLLKEGSIPKSTSYTISFSLGQFGTISETIDFTKPWWLAIRYAILVMITLALGNAFLKRITI